MNMLVIIIEKITPLIIHDNQNEQSLSPIIIKLLRKFKSFSRTISNKKNIKQNIGGKKKNNDPNPSAFSLSYTLFSTIGYPCKVTLILSSNLFFLGYVILWK